MSRPVKYTLAFYTFIMIMLVGCLTLSMQVSAQQSPLAVQVARDSQRLDDYAQAMDELRASKYIERLAVVEESVKQINESIKEAAWILRGLLLAVLTEVGKRLLGAWNKKPE